VVDVGSNVVGFKRGDIVSGEGHVVCGRCRNCMAGRRHLCKETRGIGVNRPGAFAEFVSLPMTNVWRHCDSIDRDVAAIFDPLGNAVHTALSFDVLGEDVLITGAGPIGIMAARWFVTPGPGTLSLPTSIRYGWKWHGKWASPEPSKPALISPNCSASWA
jgi:threonine 3-dehydrogenase